MRCQSLEALIRVSESIQWTDEEISLESEQWQKWLQQLENSTILTTLCENVKTICTGRQGKRVVKRYFGTLTTLCEKQTGTTHIVQDSFTQFLAWKKMSRRLFLGSSEFRRFDYIMQGNNGSTRVLEMSF